MPLQPAIPPLLSPNLSNLPYTSLILLTSTLGATTSWLVLRFICAALKSSDYGIAYDIPSTPVKHYSQRIVLVSWLRGGTWWKESGRKLVSRPRIYKSGDYARGVQANWHLPLLGYGFPASAPPRWLEYWTRNGSGWNS